MRQKPGMTWSSVFARAAFSAALFLLAACSTELPNACPPVREYDEAFTVAFADQLMVLPLPENWAIAEALSDYYVLRQTARACK